MSAKRSSSAVNDAHHQPHYGRGYRSINQNRGDRVVRIGVLASSKPIFWQGTLQPCNTMRRWYHETDARRLEVIRECLLFNWILDDTKLHRERWRRACLRGKALVDGDANVEPLLQLSQRNLPCLQPGEQRLSVLPDALVRVRQHIVTSYSTSS
jgi:hypothetical protein